MSRAFTKEDADGPERRYVLPKRDDPGYDEAAAYALIEGAMAWDSHSAELATGYSFSEKKLRPFVEQILAKASARKDERLETDARRFLK